jgi:hypothetical protein
MGKGKMSKMGNTGTNKKGQGMAKQISKIDEESRRLRFNELVADVNEERAIRAANRKTAADKNKLSLDLSTCTNRTDSRDTHEVQRWTPGLNAAFKALPRIDGDRDPSIRRLFGLLYRITICRLALIWADAYCAETDETYRFNGNTTSWLASKFPEIFQNAWIYRGHYYCDTLKELYLLYSQFDAPLSSRTPAETINPWSTSFGISIQDAIVNNLISAIEMAFNVHRYGNNKNDKEEARIATLVNHIDFFYWMQDEIFATRTDQTKPFLRICFLVFAFLIYNTGHRDKAAEFLRRVVFTNNHDYERGDICLALHDKIKDVKAPSSEAELPEAMQQIGWCIATWNAYITGSSPRHLNPRKEHPLPSVEGMSSKDRAQYGILNKSYTPPKR